MHRFSCLILTFLLLLVTPQGKSSPLCFYSNGFSISKQSDSDTSNLFTGVFAATFTFVNRCEYTLWPGILANAGSPKLDSTGFPLPQGSTRAFQAPTGWSGRFWARTGCTFDDSGSGSCQTGDCGSGLIECNGLGAAPPATLAEFTLGSGGGMDFYDVSLVDGYNVPMVVEGSGGSGPCGSTGCTSDLNQQCPDELKAACPRSYSYAYDDATSTFTCTGADYTVTFCPSSPSQKSESYTPTTPVSEGATTGQGTTGGGTQMAGSDGSSGVQYAGTGSGYGGRSETGSGYGTGSGGGNGAGGQTMLADGSWLAGLAMGGSERTAAASSYSSLCASAVLLLLVGCSCVHW
ncbi:Thaumatin-like protein 1 [Linum perenne]